MLPRDNLPCADEMTKRAAADAVRAKALGAPVAGTCSCTFDDCRSGKVVHAVTLPAIGRLVLTLMLSQTLSASPPPLPVLLTVARLSAAGARVAAHAPLVALLTDTDGACDVTLNGAAPRFDFNLDCRCTTAACRTDCKVALDQPSVAALDAGADTVNALDAGMDP